MPISFFAAALVFVFAQALSSELAEKHVKLAKWCEKNGLTRRAKLEYGLALHRDPKNGEAKKGFESLKPSDEESIAPPPVKKSELPGAWKNFEDQHRLLTQFRASADLKAAEKAKKDGKPEEEARLLRGILEYDDGHPETRKRLADIKADRETVKGLGGGWVWRRAEVDKLAQGIDTKPVEKNEDEGKLSFALNVVETEHVRVATELPIEFAKHYARTAEAGYRLIAALSPELAKKAEEKSEGKKLRCLLLLGEEHYAEAVKAIAPLSEDDKRVYASRGTYRGKGWFMTSQKDASFLRTDRFLHNGAEYAMDYLPSWLREGLAYAATREINDTSSSSCYPVERGSSVKIEEKWRQENAWRELLLEAILLKEDPASAEIFSADLKKLRGPGGVKSWSLLQFLRARDAGAFPAFVAEAARGDSVKALDAHYHLDPPALDAAWRDWALATY